jgi:hypothetical protein
MSKILALCCLFWFSAVAYNPGPATNEYAHNPLTPGYGISNYFELMPNKVKNDNGIRSRTSWSAQAIRIRSTRLAGNRLEIAFDSYAKTISGKLYITLLSPNGCIVEHLTYLPDLSSLTVLMLRKEIPRGIYIVKVQGQHLSASRKVVASR